MFANDRNTGEDKNWGGLITCTEGVHELVVQPEDRVSWETRCGQAKSSFLKKTMWNVMYV